MLWDIDLIFGMWVYKDKLQINFTFRSAPMIFGRVLALELWNLAKYLVVTNTRKNVEFVILHQAWKEELWIRIVWSHGVDKRMDSDPYVSALVCRWQNIYLFIHIVIICHKYQRSYILSSTYQSWHIGITIHPLIHTMWSHYSYPQLLFPRELICRWRAKKDMPFVLLLSLSSVACLCNWYPCKGQQIKITSQQK
jgi:hypothetical protein